MTTAAITTFSIGNEPATARIAHVVNAASCIALEDVGRDVDRTILAGAKRWSPFLREPVADVAGAAIGDFFRVSRGQVTGANAFFVMLRSEARERGIERFCVPLVTSADEIFASGGILRDTPNRLVGLELPRDLNPARYPKLAAYLAAGRRAKVHAGYVASHRTPWWSVQFPKPPIVATYMARQAPCFAYNPDRLGLLNVATGFILAIPWM